MDEIDRLLITLAGVPAGWIVLFLGWPLFGDESIIPDPALALPFGLLGATIMFLLAPTISRHL